MVLSHSTVDIKELTNVFSSAGGFTYFHGKRQKPTHVPPHNQIPPLKLLMSCPKNGLKGGDENIGEEIKTGLSVDQGQMDGSRSVIMLSLLAGSIDVYLRIAIRLFAAMRICKLALNYNQFCGSTETLWTANRDTCICFQMQPVCVTSLARLKQLTLILIFCPVYQLR